MSALSVHLNRERPRSVDAPDAFTAEGNFDVALENHGDGCHAHVSLSESLDGVARIDDGGRYVDAGGIVHVPVRTRPDDGPTTGELTVSVGYGAETATVALTVQPSRASGYGLEVDESLGSPVPATDDGSGLDLRPGTLALVAFAGVALLSAVAVAATVKSLAVVAAAALVALVAVGGVITALA